MIKETEPKKQDEDSDNSFEIQMEVQPENGVDEDERQKKELLAFIEMQEKDIDE
jgi:hypothetical protein